MTDLEDDGESVPECYRGKIRSQFRLSWSCSIQPSTGLSLMRTNPVSDDLDPLIAELHPIRHAIYNLGSDQTAIS
jgi:hypothetical protein